MAGIPVGGDRAPNGPVTRSVLHDPNMLVTGTALSAGNSAGAGAPQNHVVYKRCKASCRTCEVFANGCEWTQNEGLKIGCPEHTCPYHSELVVMPVVLGKKVAGSPTWCKGAAADLRDHIVKHHAWVQLEKLGVTKKALAQGLGVEVCSSDGCGRMALIESASTVLGRKKDPIDWECRRGAHAKHLVGPQTPHHGVGQQIAPGQGAPQRVQNGELPDYLHKAISVLQSVTVDEIQLGAVPAIMKYLPTKSKPFRDGLVKIIQDLSEALQMRGLPHELQVGLHKVFYCLPRFLFFVSVGAPSTVVRHVQTAAENVRLFLDGQAARLWAAGHNFGVSSVRYDCYDADTLESLDSGDEAMAQKKRWDLATVAAADGDITKAAQYAAPEAKVAQMSPEELSAYVAKIFTVPQEDSHAPPPSDEQVADQIT